MTIGMVSSFRIVAAFLCLSWIEFQQVKAFSPSLHTSVAASVRNIATSDASFRNPVLFDIPHKHLTTNVPLYASISDKDTNQVKNDKVIQDAFETQHTLSFTKPIPYEQITIAVMKETFPGENRVSISPDSAELLIKAGFHVIVQQGGEIHSCVTM